MNTQHTPGPWEAGDECISGTVAVWAGDALIAQAGGRRITADQSRIDARLIAAAPEMLTALRGAKALLEIDKAHREAMKQEKDEIALSVLAQIDAAIEKANA